MAVPVINSVTFDKTAYNKGDIITCTVKYSDPNTHGVTSGTGAITAVGTLIQGASLTPSVTTTTVGDFVLLHVVTEGSAPPTGISGGNCTWQQIGQTFTGTVNSGFSSAVYMGTVTAAGTATATITASGATATRLSGQEYHSSTGQVVFVSQANLDVTGSNTGPTITPTAGNQLYSFYGFDTGTATAGQTPGFTYDVDSNGNPYAFNPACTQTAQAPVFGDTGVAFGTAVLMYASLSAGTFTAVGGLIQSLTNTVSINPQNLGDLVLLHVFSIGNAPAAQVTGGNCNWQQVGTVFTGTIQAGFNVSVFAGTSIATGSATATVTFTGTATSIILLGQEYYSSTGMWQFIGQAGLDSTGTNQMPTLTPTTPGQLYAGAALDSVTSTAGTNPGYTYYTDSNGNGYLFNPACTAVAQSPAFGDSTHGFGMAVLMSAGSSGTGTTTPTPAASPLITSIATQAGTDPYGNPYPQGLSVEKGVISGAVLSAGNTLTVDNTGMSVYNGAPVPANLQLAITPAGGIVTKTPVIFNQFGGTPIANANKGATAYSGHGDMQVVDGLDQQAYATERRSLATANDQTISSTSFATFLSTSIAAGTAAREYRIHAELFIAPNQTGGKAALQWTGPGATIGHINFVYTSGTSVGNSGAVGNGVSTAGSITMTMVNGQEIGVVADGIIQVPAGVSGSFALQGAEGTSGDSFIVRQFSSVDIMPV